MASIQPLPFGELLKRARRDARLTQEELADRSGYSAAYISLLERKVRLPTHTTIDALAEALALPSAERASFHAALVHPAFSPPARVLSVSTAPSVPPLVGRTPELLELDHHLAGAGPPLLLLSGEPGIGKTRLLLEAARRAAATGWTVLEGGCYRSSAQEPYAPLLVAVSEHLHRQSAAQQRVALESCAWLVRLLPELAEQAVVPLPRWTLSPEQERRLMFAAVARYLANVAGPAGTLLVLDDLQWACTDALDLLANLLRAPGAPSLRVLGAYRSTEAGPSDPLGVVLADLGASGGASEHQVGPLAPPEARELLRGMLEERPDVDEALHAQVLVRTGGVPYFLVSCAQALRAGALEEAKHRVPWNVAQSIRQRVAVLPQAAQDVLGAAAVVGRAIPGTLLLAVAARSTTEVMAALEALDRARLLVEGAAARYQFPHDLIREVVLTDLSALRQRHWHVQVARALEQRLAAPGVPDPHLADLAYHTFEGEDWEKALEYGQRAGEQTLMLFAPRAALEHLSRTVKAAGQLSAPPPASLYRARGQAYELLAEFEHARADFEQALRLAQAARDRQMEWQGLSDLGSLWASRDFGLAGQWFRLALELAQVLAAPRLQASSLNRLGNWLVNTGQVDAGLQAHQQAMQMFERLHDQQGLADTLDLLGTANFLAGDVVTAVSQYGQAIELFRSAGDMRRLISSLSMRAASSNPRLAETTFSPLRTRDDCVQEAAEALHLARRADLAGDAAFAEMLLGYILAPFGEFGSALEHAHEARRMATEVGHQHWMAGACCALGNTYVLLLEPAFALDALEMALRVAREVGSAWWINQATLLLARAHLLKHDLPQAEAALTAALPREQRPRHLSERWVRLVWGELALALGQPEEALQIAEDFLATVPGAAHIPGGQPIPGLLSLQGAALLALGRAEEAILVLEGAKRGTIQRHELARLWSLHGSLGRAYHQVWQEEQARREFVAARTVIAQLSATIDEPTLREHFTHAALATL